MTFEDIKTIVATALPEAILGEDLNATPKALLIDASQIVPVCQLLHRQEKLYFDSLSCLTALDNGPEKGIMEVIYILYSIPYDLHLMLKVTLDRQNPEIDSVVSVWRTADWHEREAFDLVGIRFRNHPDLRRILLPHDWQGHPLQKDYTDLETYHGISVKYDRNETESGK